MKPCNKMRYESKALAKEALARIKAKHPDRTERHEYYCPQCDCYHLTSLSRERSKFVGKGKYHGVWVEKFKQQEQLEQYWLSKLGILND